MTPMRTAQACRFRLCGSVAVEHGYCADHAYLAHQKRKAAWAKADKGRGSSSERGYDARWQKLRRYYLAVNPLCAKCERTGRTTPATVVHHIDSDQTYNHLDNLMALCRGCHERVHGRKI